MRYGHSSAGAGESRGWRRTHARGSRGGDEPRDLEIARLEERVRVLERIVTDRRAALLREFERLEADR
jgi:hypothetical protein